MFIVYNRGMDKCYIIFEDGREPYEFPLDKMATAIQFSHDNKWPVLAIKTPYYYMSLIDGEDFENIMKGTPVKLPSGNVAMSVVESEGGEADSQTSAVSS